MREYCTYSTNFLRWIQWYNSFSSSTLLLKKKSITLSKKFDICRVSVKKNDIVFPYDWILTDGKKLPSVNFLPKEKLTLFCRTAELRTDGKILPFAVNKFQRYFAMWLNSDRWQDIAICQNAINGYKWAESKFC